IDFGARMSGRLDKNWRIGLMDMKTSADESKNLLAQNFAVVALQRKLFKKSSLEMFYIDKTQLDYDGYASYNSTQPNRYNRNFGFEFMLAPKNNTWSGKTILIKSFTPNKSGDDFLNAANLQYSSKNWIVSWQHEIVGNNFNAEVGYIPRNNYVKFNPSVTRLFFPKKGNILSHGPQFLTTYYFNTALDQTDNTKSFTYLITYRDKSTLSGVVQNDYVELLAPFDPTRIGKQPLAAHTKHEWNTIGFDFISAPQHRFTYTLSSRTGGYYANGKLFSLTANVGYRIQPYVNIDISSTYNHIDLPQPWGKNNFLLVGPKVDITMTNTLFFTTFFQYNEQTTNINFNTRFQWRYKPASDLFIVYTDNYYIGPVFVKNRAVVLKFTYWWNK
ncbi:MAG: hydrolase, partial [Sediminibacterium sp.]